MTPGSVTDAKIGCYADLMEAQISPCKTKSGRGITAQDTSQLQIEASLTGDSPKRNEQSGEARIDDRNGSFCFHCGLTSCKGVGQLPEHPRLMVLGSGSLMTDRDEDDD